MKKRIGLLSLVLFLLGVGPSAQASTLISDLNKLFYTNYETVFRADVNGNYYEIDQSGGPVDLEINDIFVGIINIQEITDKNNTLIWDNPTGDEITGIFAQQVTNISGHAGGIYVDLGVTSVDTFYAIDDVTAATLTYTSFTTGLNSNEMFELYYDDGSGNLFTTGGTSILTGIAAATDGTSWMVLGDDDTPSVPYSTFNVSGEEYAWSDVTPFGTAFVNFDGDAFIGLSVLEYAESFILGDPLLNDPSESRFGSNVQFYANSELTVNPEYVALGQNTQAWVFESNDPARVNASVVPEPNTVLLLGIGLLGAAGFVRRKTR